MADDFLASGKEIVQQVFSELAPELKTLLSKEIRNKKLVDSGELLNSLRTQVQSDTMLLGFSEHGFFQDRKKYISNENAPALIEWVEKNFDRLGFAAAFEGEKTPTIRANAVKQIAFAIRAKQKKKNSRPKSRPWLYKKFWQWYQKMVEKLLENLSEEQITALLKNA